MPLIFLIAAPFAVSASAQAPAIKVVFINSAAFEGKDGITQYQKAIDLAIGEPGFLFRANLCCLVVSSRAEKDEPRTSHDQRIVDLC